MMKQYIYLLVLIFTFFSCSSEDDSNNPNNNPPTNFSANALGTGIDSGNVIWTESNDVDDDPITYYVFLEDELISSTTALTFDFSGLEPDTIYAGYVEARDGNGGNSRADFSFVTEPEVIIFNVNASSWIYDQFPETSGLRTLLRAGFIVPYYEDATSYHIEILDYALFGTITTGDQDQNGNVYTWTNESQSVPIGSVFADQTITGDYGVAFAKASINTLQSSYDENVANFAATTGEARVTVVIGSSD